MGGGKGGQEGGGMGRDRWQQGGEVWKGATGRWRWGGEQQGRKGSGSKEWDKVEGEMERAAMGGGGKMGRGQRGKGRGERGGMGRGRRRRKKEEGGGEISQIDMMECLGGHRL